MNRKTGICILIIVLAVLLLWAGVLLRRNALQKETPTDTETQTEDETMVVASAANPQAYVYLVREQDETLVVYLGDGETVYMETGIKSARIPDALRRQLATGIGFLDEESLFEFLENYAS
jgi:flagellar basal body-associated protein FliL